MKYKYIAIIIIITAFTSNAYSIDRSDYIRQYLDYSGVTKSLRSIVDMQAEITLRNISRKHNLSNAFKEDFKDVWNDVMVEDFWSPGGFLDMLMPVFDNFTISELKEIIKFYKSPVGRKLSNLTLEMQNYIRSIMPKWEQRTSKIILPKMIKELEKRGWDQEGNRIKN